VIRGRGTRRHSREIRGSRPPDNPQLFYLPERCDLQIEPVAAAQLRQRSGAILASRIEALD
jgi:hypothetical protein